MESSPAKKPRMEKTYLPTPKWLKQQESIVNVKNEDNQCFKWSILAALNPVTGDAADDVASYTSFENNLNFDELNFPILIKDIPKFEENNKNFSVNIYSCEKKHVLPTIKSMAVNKKEINLLRITSRGKQHYCWIKDLQIFLNANSESSHLPTPKWLQKTKSIVNVKNYDNQCFKWSILAALHPVNGDVAEDVSSYTSFEKDLKFCELNFPISIKDIPKFEENNNNICVNVYVVQNETLGTAYTSQVLNKMEINLLLISCKGKQHYCWIKDLGSVLFANPGSSYIPTPGWLKRKESIVNVKNNDEECFKWSILAALHPAQIDAAENVSSYTSFENELSFNEMNIPISLKDIPKFEKNNNLRISVYSFVENKRIFLAYTGQGTDEENINLLLIWEKKRQHFCWIKDLGLFLTGDGESSYCQYCLGQNIFQPDFPVEDHKRLCKKHGYQAIELPSKEKNVFNKQTPFEASEISFVIYAHIMCFTGKYQSEDVKMSGKNQNVISVHSTCGYAYKVVGSKPDLSEGIQFYRGENAAEKFVKSLIKEETSIKEKLTTMKDSRKRWIPVIMHNLKKCHSHLIIQAFKSIHEKDGDVKFGCLTSSLQKFVCFSVGYLQFIDSSSFLDSPLATLVNNLQQSFNDKAFQNTSKLTEGRNDKLKLLLKKCVYPYDYMDSEDKFNNQFLPTMEEFNSKLLDRVVTKEDYNHAVNVWRIFDIESLGGYHDLYIKTHVLLLADVFENFRKTMLQYYNIDPARGYSTPWLSWQAALKMTRTELELLTDVSMHLVIESGIRGGVAMLSKRYAKGNNPNVPGYDEKQPTTWIIYLDANNLYGWAMSQPLPTRNFKWLNEEDIKYLDVQNIDDNADTGYILEVDLEYPEELHNEHNDFPLAPEKIELTSEMLSPYCKKLFEELGMKEPTGDRLIPNLRNKEKYVVHYRTLKLYLKLGLVLTKVHRVISFKQTSWLKPYINFNTDRRKQSNSEVQKDFFKLMNNSVYGKTAEKVRKYNKEVKFVFSDTELDEAKKRPDFQDFIDVNGMKIVMYKKVSVLLDQPIFVGFTVLDLAKAFIYDFHYNHMRARYGDRAQLLFTDTDSLCYEVETKNIYNDLNDMNQKKDLFDFSNYIDKKHPLFNNRNKNVVGKMKEETCGVPIEEFVGLNPKMYTLKYGGKEIKKAKGVPAEFKDEHITFEDYKKCFTEDQQMKGEITKMKSLNHQLRTVKETRVTLSPYDDKRFIFKDGIHSRAYGHFIISRED